jgi:hypothetical protein
MKFNLDKVKSRTRRPPHPTSGEELRLRALSEKGRTSRLSRVRELVLGFQDGLLVPLAVLLFEFLY